MYILLLLVNESTILDFKKFRRESFTDITTDGYINYCYALICQLEFSMLPGTLLHTETLRF